MSLRLAGYGISIDLPARWEGRIAVRPPTRRPAGGLVTPGRPADPRGGRSMPESDVGAPGESPSSSRVGGGSVVTDARTFPVVHAANFALPADRGDFGSGAVDVMGQEGVLIVLVEYGDEAVGTPLFATNGLPLPEPNQFRPESLQRRIPGQLGYQRFFTEAGRAFCSYVVLGSAARLPVLATTARSVLATARFGAA